MPGENIHIEALNSLGALLYITFACLGIIVLSLVFSPRNNSSITTLIAFGVWIIAIGTICYFTFNPAIRAMKFANSSSMFIIIGTLSGIILATLRHVRKDVYGVIEILVSLTILYILGKEYDDESKVSIIIGLVSAVYVIVRGIDNIATYWKSNYSEENSSAK